MRKSKTGPEIILGAWIMIILGIGTYVGLDQDGKRIKRHRNIVFVTFLR